MLSRRLAYTFLLLLVTCSLSAQKRERKDSLVRLLGCNELQQKDFDNMYNAGYGYGYGVRTIIDPAKGNLNGSIGAFGWTGFFGTWCEADPAEGVGIVYMHNVLPSREEYYHHLVRAAAYGLIE